MTIHLWIIYLNNKELPESKVLPTLQLHNGGCWKLLTLPCIKPTFHLIPGIISASSEPASLGLLPRASQHIPSAPVLTQMLALIWEKTVHLYKWIDCSQLFHSVEKILTPPIPLKYTALKSQITRFDFQPYFDYSRKIAYPSAPVTRWS